MAQRDRVERGVIALLSNANAAALVDPPSDTWLGRVSPSKRVRASGLWNQNYVREAYSPAVIVELKRLIEALGDGRGP